mmetsp:Transcript_32573/g.74688  ORF Transcript_32573/g.74688 Transcript_32573/m.74688 type:complete len:568 (-) Transcript_32573:460-2163(-)
MGCGASKKRESEASSPDSTKSSQLKKDDVKDDSTTLTASSQSNIKGKEYNSEAVSRKQSATSCRKAGAVAESVGCRMNSAAERVQSTIGDGADKLVGSAESVVENTMVAAGFAAEFIGEAFEKQAVAMQAVWRGKKARELTDRRFAQQTLETNQAKLKRNAAEQVTKVNQYSLSKVLGKGAFGEVFKGTSGLGAEPVAIKVLNRSILKRKRVGRNGNAYDSVLREVAVMKRLKHPHVVNLYEVIDDPDKDQLFLVLEFVSGGDLSKPIKEKRRPPEAELRIWLQGVLLGLEHLHLSGIIHRDIKPENIMWDSKRQAAKLTDFGISTFFDNEHVGGDFVESTGGTFFFFAPEMTRSRQGAGYSAKAADVWAVGVSLYMWLYHKPPFEAPSMTELLQVIYSDPVPYPEDNEISPELCALLHSMLEKLPKERFRASRLRTDPFLTNNGAETLPEPTAKPEVNIKILELKSVLSKVKIQSRMSMSENRSLSNTDAESFTSFPSEASIDEERASQINRQSSECEGEVGGEKMHSDGEASASEVGVSMENSGTEYCLVQTPGSSPSEAPAPAS